MAKKSRRARRRVTPIAQTVRAAPPPRVAAPLQVPVSQPVAEEVDLEEYRYVIDDLKRIAVIALILLGLLLVLAVLIR